MKGRCDTKGHRDIKGRQDLKADVIERKKRLTGNCRSSNIETNLVSNRAEVHIADVVADKEARRRHSYPKARMEFSRAVDNFQSASESQERAERKK
ncbi:hypothetical protein G5I_08615 [Acromyrmex echinatior]|uniref:Uncharacterized protein n=1 Tax=Acromyrmex echinatior TaxID=103372 RepID=F4WS07_ACREC|nr:hypothetical protein G5I_08615 [Acromyrmex echinatior]